MPQSLYRQYAAIEKQSATVAQNHRSPGVQTRSNKKAAYTQAKVMTRGKKQSLDASSTLALFK